MDVADVVGALDPELLAGTLRAAGCRFAFLHGSRVSGSPRADSDLDVAAWFGGDPGDWWATPLPAGVDLMPIERLPLELAGRVALHGVLLFDDDPPARVRWQADTRLRYLDERWRQAWINRLFVQAHRRG